MYRQTVLIILGRPVQRTLPDGALLCPYNVILIHVLLATSTGYMGELDIKNGRMRYVEKRTDQELRELDKELDVADIKKK